MAVHFVGPEQVFYAVDGATLAAVAETIAQKDEAGKTEWLPRYDYETTGDNVSDVSVTVTTRMTLPNWSGYSAASQPERDEWDRFSSVLQDHERGHVELVEQRLAGIDQVMTGQSLKDAQAAWESALQELASASDDYDAQSDHGRKHGAVIDLSVIPT